jgi:hypothetical protein
MAKRGWTQMQQPFTNTFSFCATPAAGEKLEHLQNPGTGQPEWGEAGEVPSPSFRRFLHPLSTSIMLLALLLLVAPASANQPGYYTYPYYPQGAPQRQPWGQPGYAPQQPSAPAQGESQPRQQRPVYPGWGQPGSQPQYAPRQPQYPPSQPRYNPNQQQYNPAQPQYRPQRPQAGASRAEVPASAELEIELGDRLLYVQQSTVLTLRVVSDNNLRTATPELPGGGKIVYKKLDGPTSELRGGKVVNRYRYAVTPLTSGDLLLPLISVTGETSGGQRFEAVADAPLRLNVLPAQAGLNPWLPLQGLILQTYLSNERGAEAGKPITLTVDISAVGTTGSQLPSLEEQLSNTRDFKVYRESGEIEGKVSGDGRFLSGDRTETFTLIPTHGGKVRIPALEISWFNVVTGSAETSTVPIRQLIAKGDLDGFDQTASERFPGMSSLLLWIPIVGMFAVTIGFWILAWLRHKPFIQLIAEEFQIGLHLLGQLIARLLVWLSPIRRLQRLRQITVRRLPTAWRMWFCVKLVQPERDPEIWTYMLKFLANKHLKLPPQRSMTALGREMALIHPRANPETLQQLMEQLDNYLYGHRDELDFEQWKRQFRRQLRPGLLFWRRKSETREEATGKGLPVLNP